MRTWMKMERQQMKTNEIRKTLNEIDAKFADIQKYINNIDFLDDSDKGSLLTRCIACNDDIVKLIIGGNDEKN